MEGSGKLGVAYVALGDPRFAGEACQSARSLARFMPDVPIILYTDGARAPSDATFSAIVRITGPDKPQRVGEAPWHKPGWLSRIDAMRQLPFERTLFLDTDTEIVSDPSSIFNLLTRFEVVAAHAPFRFRKADDQIPSSFPELNCGVIGLSRTPGAKRFLDCWRREYLADRQSWHHDQTSFRVAAWQSDVGLGALPPEFNVRPKRLDGRNVPRIFHGFSRPKKAELNDRRVRYLTTDHGCRHHRSGWEYALKSLTPLTHPRGVLLDTMVENTFGWHLPRYGAALPIAEAWLGIVHNPPNIPEHYYPAARPQVIGRSQKFRESLGACRGLFALSRYQADAMTNLGVPIDVLYHPVEQNVPQFDFEHYCRAHSRQVLHVGWWLRRFESFARLHPRRHAKHALSLPSANAAREIAILAGTDVTIQPYLSHAEFDRLLACSIVFVDLIDASANNIILDCVARATPIVVNRHPAVCEYLGEDYPLLYDDLPEAEAIMDDDELVWRAHAYLCRGEFRARFSGETFRLSMLNSPLYQMLPNC